MRLALAISMLLGWTELIHAAAIKRSSSAQTVVYWGQSSAERSLSDYCASGQGINVIVLSFLTTFGNGQTPSGTFGEDCSVDSTGTGQGCETLASDITSCQAAGVKVLLSLGGAASSGSVTSQADAEALADSLWNSYANPSAVDSSAPRPFGSAFVNGWDLDIESNPSGNNQYYQYLVTKLRSYFPSDSSNTYYISGAPQCPLPEVNMGDIINNSKFDYLFVQFYNNPYCSAYQVVRPDDGSGDGFNFNAWQTYVDGTASKGASLFIGLPASPLSANGEESGAEFFLSGSELPTVLNQYSTAAGFGGVMLWQASTSDSEVIGGCTYAQEVSSVLKTGSGCDGSGGSTPASVVSSSAIPSTTAAPTVSSKPVSSATVPATTAASISQPPAFAPSQTALSAASTVSASAIIPTSSATAAPVPAPSTSSPPLPSSTCAAGSQPCSSDGSIVCIGSTQFGLCNFGCAVPQTLAAGTVCSAGVIGSATS